MPEPMVVFVCLSNVEHRGSPQEMGHIDSIWLDKNKALERQENLGWTGYVKTVPVKQEIFQKQGATSERLS